MDRFKTLFHRLLLSIFLTTVFPFAVLAASIDGVKCAAVDLRDKFGEIQNQGRTGFCYAAAVSDFLSFYLQRPVSSTSVAASYIQKASGIERSLRKIIMGTSKWTMGGLPGMALKRLGKIGICLEETTSSDQFENANELLLAGDTELANACQSNNRTKKFAIDLEIQGPGVVDSSLGVGLDLINSELNSNRPAMIVYNVGGVFPEWAVRGLHVSNVVGRRMGLNNECEYLIRNSWGVEFEEAGYGWISQKTLKKSLDSVYALRSLKFKKH